MDESTFRDRSVLETLGRVVAVRVSIDDAKAFTFEFKVKSVPWLLVIDPYRREKLAEHTGFAEPAQVIALVDAALAAFKRPAGGQDPGQAVGLLYKRTGLSLEAPAAGVVLDFWSHQLVQAIGAGDGDFDGETLRVRHSIAGLQGTFGKSITAMTLLDFGADRPLTEAWAEYQFTKPLTLRAGRFKVPMGTEFAPRRDFWDFVEPGHYTVDLLPRRDVGAMLYGGGGFYNVFMKYWVGAFNGVPDGYGDVDGSRETVAKVLLNPLPRPGFDLNLGAAWTAGRSEEALTTFRVTDESITDILRFPAGTTLDGRRRRASLEGELLWGPFALGAERIVQRSGIVAGGAGGRHGMEGRSAWASWILTGERKSRDEWLRPTWEGGAFEIVARASTFEADESLAPLALPGRFARKAVQWTAGLNWTPDTHLRVMLNVMRSRFADPVQASPGDLEDQHTVVLMATELRF